MDSRSTSFGCRYVSGRERGETAVYYKPSLTPSSLEPKFVFEIAGGIEISAARAIVFWLLVDGALRSNIAREIYNNEIYLHYSIVDCICHFNSLHEYLSFSFLIKFALLA